MSYYPLKLQKESNMIATKDGGIQSTADKKPKIIGVIPARYASTRFPGKPLADIHGKPMIWWVYQQAKKVTELDEVYVATDDERIADACKRLDIESITTLNAHRTGVDRLAEVALGIEADYYILIQGDEPLIESELISDMAKLALDGEIGEDAATFKTRIRNPIDVANHTVIKIVTDVDDNMIFASRSTIPYPQKSIDFAYYKTVGVYCYPRSIALAYPNLKVGYLEEAEDHDLVRLLANGVRVKSFERETVTVSVDTPKDLERVRELILPPTPRILPCTGAVNG
jgi:3-deoxy-manno-octulosonate cytidylyltransferase (CMP-KDO synthetase)